MRSLSSAPTHRKPAVRVVSVQTFRRPEGTRYVVTLHGANSTVYDEVDHTTEFAAYVAAGAMAVRLRAKLQASDTWKARLIAFWRRRGRRMFYADQPRSLCANKYERQAYDQAEAEVMAYLDEADRKPGLTDCVPMTVYPGEYGAGVAA